MLLAASGADLDRLYRRRRRCATRGSGCCGRRSPRHSRVHPVDRLLQRRPPHVRGDAEAGGTGRWCCILSLMRSSRSPRRRRAGSPAGAVHAGGDRPGYRWPRPAPACTYRVIDRRRLYPGHGVRRRRRPGLLPDLNPGVMSWTSQPAQAGPAVDGHDAEDDLVGALTRPRARRRSAPGRATRGRRRRRTRACMICSATGLVGGHRRDPRGAAPRRPLRRARRLRAYVLSRKRIVDTLCEARHGHAPRRRPGPSRASCCHRGHPPPARARRRASRRRPNLVDHSEGADECRALLGAGIDDWGGVSPLTPDHVNPERPWPSLGRLEAITAECGFELAARLTVHPEYVRAGEPWLDPRISAHVAALAREDGLARPGVRPDRAAVAGAGRRLRLRGPHRPVRSCRHRGPHRRPPLGLLRRLRRLGLGAGRCRRVVRDRTALWTTSLHAESDGLSRRVARPRRRTRATSRTSTR